MASAEPLHILFFDGHVAIHKITDTIGARPANSPKGMWTMVAGD